MLFEGQIPQIAFALFDIPKMGNLMTPVEVSPKNSLKLTASLPPKNGWLV